jgi:hypothetical protein
MFGTLFKWKATARAPWNFHAGSELQAVEREVYASRRLVPKLRILSAVRANVEKLPHVFVTCCRRSKTTMPPSGVIFSYIYMNALPSLTP